MAPLSDDLVNGDLAKISGDSGCIHISGFFVSLQSCSDCQGEKVNQIMSPRGHQTKWYVYLNIFFHLVMGILSPEINF